MENNKVDFKIIILGKSGTGKTSYANKWIKNTFNENYKSTIVSEFSSKLYKYKDRIYKINLWDIAGQDHHAVAAKVFMKDALGCITMSDAIVEESLNEALNWKKFLDENELFPDKNPIPNMLIQNKIDLVPENEVQDMTKLENFCKENKFDCCFKTSAKTGYNVNQSMDKLIEIIAKRLDDYTSKEVIDLNRKTVNIDPENHSEKDKYRTKQAGCC